MNILTKSILTLVALAATGLHAEVFPIAEDTFGTTAKSTILKASGAAKAIIINAKTKAYMSFDVGGSGIPASAVSNARLTIYVAKATKTGTLFLANATGAFSETFTDKSIPMPSDAIISTIGLSDSASREFITFDVTDQVKAWLATPSSENGFVLTADGTLALTIATKEGAGTGHPAVLEVDVTPTEIIGGSATFTGGVSSTGFSTDGPNASFFVNTGFPPGGGSTTLVAGLLGKNSNGPQLRFQEDGSSNFVDIGTDGSDNFVIENRFDQAMVTVTPAGKVGIGTTQPSDLLTLESSSDPTIALKHTGTNGFAGIHTTTSLRSWFFGNRRDSANWTVYDNTATTPRLNVSGNVGTLGFVGIGTETPFANLHIQRAMTGLSQESPFRITKGDATNNILWMRSFGDGLPVNMELFEGDAFKPGGGAWGVVSDRRLKKDIEPLTSALDKVLQLRSVTYEYKEPAKNGQLPGTQIGFIAQEVEEVFPDWITVNADGYKTVNIRGFESLTVQSLRELRAEKDAEIAALKAELAALKAANTALETGIAARLGRLEAAAASNTVTTTPVNSASIEAK